MLLARQRKKERDRGRERETEGEREREKEKEREQERKRRNLLLLKLKFHHVADIGRQTQMQRVPGVFLIIYTEVICSKCIFKLYFKSKSNICLQ